MIIGWKAEMECMAAAQTEPTKACQIMRNASAGGDPRARSAAPAGFQRAVHLSDTRMVVIE